MDEIAAWVEDVCIPGLIKVAWKAVKDNGADPELVAYSLPNSTRPVHLHVLRALATILSGNVRHASGDK